MGPLLQIFTRAAPGAANSGHIMALREPRSWGHSPRVPRASKRPNPWQGGESNHTKSPEGETRDHEEVSIEEVSFICFEKKL